MPSYLRKLALPVLAIAGVLGYTAYWHVVADRVPEWLAGWVDAARRQGYVAEHGTVEVGGFPLRLVVTVADVTLGGRDAYGAWTWRAPTLVALFKPWDFARGLVTLPPEHALERRPGGTFHVSQGLNQTALVIIDGDLAKLGVDVRDLAITDPAGRVTSAREGEVRYELGEDDEGQVQRTFGFKLTGMTLPGAPLAGFPAAIDAAILVARLPGQPPVHLSRADLERWRDAGGALELDLARLRWGALDLVINGTATFDDLFRPLGAFTVTIAGYDDLLATLSRAGALTPAQGLAVGVALDAVAVDDGQGVRRAEIALTLQDGWLSVGPLPVAPLTPLPLD
ncbi:MAG: DUF2125 domain-containing protein [Alphaproteobacteria bacterium]